MKNAPKSPKPKKKKISEVAVYINPSTLWGREVLRGINAYARERGSWILRPEFYLEDQAVDVPKNWRGDGIIARVHNDAFAEQLHRLKVPVLNVSQIKLKSNYFPCVTSDLVEASKIAVRHFHERGFVHFAYFSHLSRSYVSIHRAIFINTVKKMGLDYIEISSDKTIPESSSPEIIDQMLVEKIKELPKTTAILTWNAESALMILRICQQHQIAVPDEIALLCGTYDDILCELSSIPISGIHVKGFEIGYTAAVHLDQMIHHRQKKIPPSTHIPPSSVIQRLSTDIFNVSDQVLCKALLYFKNHLSEKLNMTEVAFDCGVSRRVLERKFQTFIQKSPAQQLQRMRAEEAKKLIAETKLSFFEIAESVGFSDQSHLISIFRMLYRQTPRQFRQDHAKCFGMR